MSAPLWLGGYGAAAIVLVAGGAAKAAKPDGTARALRHLLPSPRFGAVASAVTSPVAIRAAVRAAGAAEVVIGGAALVAGGRWPALLIAGSYFAFAIVVGTAVRRNAPLTSCGCFGEVDAPPTAGHAAVNLAFAAIAASVVAEGARPAALVPRGVEQVAGGHPLVAGVFVLLTASVAYLAYLVMAVLPQTVAAARALRPAQPEVPV